MEEGKKGSKRDLAKEKADGCEKAAKSPAPGDQSRQKAAYPLSIKLKRLLPNVIPKAVDSTYSGIIVHVEFELSNIS